MIAVTDNPTTIIVALVAAVTGGGLWQGIRVLSRLKVDKEGVTIASSETVLRMQESINQSLQSNLDHANKEITALRARVDRMSDLETNLRQLQHENEVLKAENTALGAQVRHLEAQVAELLRRTPS